MLVPNDIQIRVRKEVERCYEAAAEFYGRTFTFPTLEFNLRGTTAGTANFGTQKLRFNSILLVENVEDFMARTVPHEVAHLIDHAVNPHNFEGGLVLTRGGHFRRKKRNVHGADFKFIMERVLGAVNSSRCHSYDVTNAKVNKRTRAQYVWVSKQDSSVTMELGIKRHNNMSSGQTRYWPRGQRHHTFVFSHIEGPVPTALAADTRLPTPPKTRGTSTKEHARVVFMNTKTRGPFIQRCVDTLGMKKTTASTYFYNFNSGKW